MQQKRVSHIKLGPISKEVLAVVASAGAISLLLIFPGLAHAIHPFIKPAKRKKASVRVSIEGLIKNGLLVQEVDKNGDVRVTLSKRGKWEVGILNLFRKSNKDWDGKWRIVIFDIPESKRYIRRELRRAVTMYGFVKLQQSVWVYPYPCQDFVELIRSYLEIKKDVISITAASIENDNWLRKEFALHK